ncbi:MAG: DUF4919 domain-containing protein, partial [Paramuribaculum sp.]|nr:DUF4919 domain-containing protein [Paramuribaculum sp.]
MKPLRTIVIALTVMITATVAAGASKTGADDTKFTTETPDLEAIQKATYDRHSPYYYPRLM